MRTQRSIVSLLAFVFAAHTFADVASTDGFNKYKVIIEKSPFRKGATTNPLPPTQSVQSLMLTGAFCGDATKKVWIKDTKTNKTSYVGEGEKVLDYKVVAIDCENQTVVLSLGLTEERLAFPSKSRTMPVAASAARPAYHSPGRAMLPTPNPGATPPPPAPTPAAIAAPAGGAIPAPGSPGALRRRILRQQVKPVTPAPEAQPQPAEDPRSGEGDAANEASGEADQGEVR